MEEVTGRTLQELGYKPGKWFKAAILHANEHGLRGDSLRAYLDSQAPTIYEPHETPVEYHRNIEPVTEDERSNLAAVEATMEIVMRTPTVVEGAIMPDACPTSFGEIPVGGVVATRGAIHPAMHSADICCSVMCTDLGTADPRRVLDAAQTKTHFGGGGRSDPFTLPDSLARKFRGDRYLKEPSLLTKAQFQLGTQGDGNHFLFVGRSEETGHTVVVTHHGSRGVGAGLYKQGMRVAERFRKEISPRTPKQNAWIPTSDTLGNDYWESLQLVREWTKLNHSVIHDAIASELTIDPHDRFWNEHNFVFRDGDLFYHAKGATPILDDFVPDARDGLRIVPMNMSEPILVIVGEKTESNLGFAPHGAGRNYSRGEHRRRNSGITEEDMFREETAGLDVRFFSGNIDTSELPSAYKSADSVIAQMERFKLGTVRDRIVPYGCIMAGDWMKDAPWKKR